MSSLISLREITLSLNRFVCLLCTFILHTTLFLLKNNLFEVLEWMIQQIFKVSNFKMFLISIYTFNEKPCILFMSLLGGSDLMLSQIERFSCVLLENASISCDCGALVTNIDQHLVFRRRCSVSCFLSLLLKLLRRNIIRDT